MKDTATHGVRWAASFGQVRCGMDDSTGTSKSNDERLAEVIQYTGAFCLAYYEGNLPQEYEGTMWRGLEVLAM